MAKKPKKKPEKAQAAWLTSYADFITAMFGFFVILFALSEVDEAAFAEFAAAAARRPVIAPVTVGGAGQGISTMMGNGLIQLPDLSIALVDSPPGRGPGEGGSGSDRYPYEHPPPTEWELTIQALLTYFGEEGAVASGEIGVPGGIIIEFIEETDTILITFGDGMLFHSGSAAILPQTFEMLDYIAGHIALHPNLAVSVIGHTDNVPMRSVQFPNNYALSFGRAMNVGLYLIEEHGIPYYRVSFTGHGERFPVGDNNTSEGRALNRRVEIELVPMPLPATTDFD